MNNTTELIFLLDRSGSMAGLESDTIGGFNTMLEKQKRNEGACMVTTVLFNHCQMTLHDRKDIRSIRPLSDYDYIVRGSTALLDAMGETIRHVKTLHGWMGRAERPDRVMFVVTTDGLENSSQTYTHRQIKSMIETQRKEHDWEFIFLGANMDAVREADHLGISPSRAARYHADEKGTRMNFQSLDDAIDDFRANGKIDENWSEKISSYANKKHHDT